MEAALAAARTFPEIDFKREVTIGHLLADIENANGLYGKVNPPIRPRADVEALGPEPLLRSALAAVNGIERAFIYGSWADPAERSPADIDLLVIGDPDVGEVYDAASAVEAEIGRPVNITVRSPAEWAEADGAFERAVKSGPRIDLR